MRRRRIVINFFKNFISSSAAAAARESSLERRSSTQAIEGVEEVDVPSHLIVMLRREGGRGVRGSTGTGMYYNFMPNNKINQEWNALNGTGNEKRL